jgi:hypothetical protein
MMAAIFFGGNQQLYFIAAALCHSLVRQYIMHRLKNIKCCVKAIVNIALPATTNKYNYENIFTWFYGFG